MYVCTCMYPRVYVHTGRKLNPSLGKYVSSCTAVPVLDRNNNGPKKRDFIYTKIWACPGPSHPPAWLVSGAVQGSCRRRRRRRRRQEMGIYYSCKNENCSRPLTVVRLLEANYFEIGYLTVMSYEL